MKRDCPHCHKSMGGRFVKWRKFANIDHSKNCPICGKDLEFHTYPEEIAARLLTVVVVIAGGYWAKERGGYLSILVTVTVILVAVYVLLQLRLRNQQRFKKGRFSS